MRREYFHFYSSYLILDIAHFCSHDLNEWQVASVRSGPVVLLCPSQLYNVRSLHRVDIHIGEKGLVLLSKQKRVNMFTL